MFRSVKRIFVLAMMCFVCNLLSVNSLECVSISNQEYIVIPENVKVNSNKPLFFSF